MRIAIFDPFSGIAGDMCLGALLDVGLDPSFIDALPSALRLDGVAVRRTRVTRGQVAAWKVDFDIPPQPHGRHLKHLVAIVEASEAPAPVKAKAIEAFTAITNAEAVIHGTTVEKVHLHEVGAVDAILDIVGTIWGLERLGVARVFSGPVQVGDGFVDTQHGRMAVPTAATLRLLEGQVLRPGPDGAGELTTPTGAVLLRVLSEGLPPKVYVPVGSGFGAGTKDFPDRANALRVILAEVEPVAPAGGVTREEIVVLSADLDDASGEEIAAVSGRLRAAGALDVVLLPSVMKKGRPGTRIEVIARPAEATALEGVLLHEGPTIGVRRMEGTRAVLSRREESRVVFGHPVRFKVVAMPDGSERAKPEFDDVQAVADRLGRPVREVLEEARKSF
ncbi:MAG: nickel pincer cofactor biosynthesis protein LarC [Gemmatimonadetes bacterium]|nr:nickel pincer cofactor biosynthesis protein LarC [Gemmatimonadota bacterium]